MQREHIGLVALDFTGLTPKLEQIIRAFDELARAGLVQRVHARMIEETLGNQLIGQISQVALPLTCISAQRGLCP